VSPYRLDYYDGDGYLCYDPDGRYHGLPSYPWGGAPEGLATYRQLAALGLRPGGQNPVAQILRPRRGRRSRQGPLVGYLYSVDSAKPKRRVTEAMRRAALVAAASKRWCGSCQRDPGYIPPARTGRRCWDCVEAAELVA
jgi:hypothetical protein